VSYEDTINTLRLVTLKHYEKERKDSSIVLDKKGELFLTHQNTIHKELDKKKENLEDFVKEV